MHVGFSVYYFRNLPFQDAVKQSLKDCMVKTKDSANWSKKNKWEEHKIRITNNYGVFKIYSE